MAYTYPIKYGTSLPYKIRDGGHPVIKHYYEAASQSFIAGDLVYLSSNALTVCGADPAAILGMALADATNVSSGMIKIPVLVFTEELELTMQVYHATAASATFSDESGKGVAYEIVKNAAGKWMVDIAATSSTRVTVIDYSDDDKGSIYMPVIVKFLAANLEYL